MEQCLTDVKININRIREDSKSNIELIASKKKQIIEEVSRLKSQIIQHLDKLQEDLMTELGEVENKCCVHIASNISSVDDQDKGILQCNTEIENLKKYASDIQTFLGMKDLQQKITKHEKFIQSLIETKKLERVELEFINNATIQKFLSDDMRFGSITAKSCPSAGIELVRKKYRQAQISITDKNQSVHKVKLLFRQRLNTSCGNTRGGCATANGEFLFINYQMFTEKLVVVSAEGKIKYEIPLSKPYSSYDITCLDDKTVAVSTGKSDDKTDYNITTIVDTVLPECSYITTYADNIFYTNPKDNEVSCSSYSGELVWKFKNERTLKTPLGITVDDKGNVFVVGKSSKNILVISNDGKQYTQIQTSQYGLSAPNNKRICMTEDLLKLLMKTVRGGDFKPEKHVSVNRPAFLAYAKTSSKVGNVIKFDDVETNIGKHYSPSTGVFTVPQNGLYSFGCMIISSGKHHVSYHWMKNDAFLSNGFAPASSHAASQSQNIVLSLKKEIKCILN
ncbi:C1QL [Mytilus edulis]|uniref:C1QL n=1 Tax=Mytilus edulis TaxID=6550 RepID=A0A8S3UPZ0_MYTED|nr:C1QL [Mytilus edulis]